MKWTIIGLRFIGFLARLRALFNVAQIRQEQKQADTLATTTEALHEKEREAAIYASPERSIPDNLDELRQLRSKQAGGDSAG